ncbi:CreA family protein [Paraburkholderia strydomiana]|uniref:CreA family protein n=1 Tax=Paraburkholderia strydomiana TaxID=1245417 RepID=UPI0038B74640
MIKLFPRKTGLLIALLFVPFSAAVARELATIETHSQRYGSRIAISAYADPLVKGVTCYVSKSHSDSALGNSRISGASDATASCAQTGTISVPETIPRQAQVFTAAVDPTFDSLHVIRVMDTERNAIVYFCYTEDDVAGNLPGQIHIIPLPADPKVPAGLQ